MKSSKMSNHQPSPWNESCPVLIGPRWLDLVRGSGWVFLGASLVLHTILLIVLPRPGTGLTGMSQTEMYVKLNSVAAAAENIPDQPPPLPEALPAPRERQSAPALPGKPAPAPGKPVANSTPAQANAGPPGSPADAGEVVAGNGSGGEPVYSGHGTGGGVGPGSEDGSGPASGTDTGTGTGTAPSYVPPAPAPPPPTPKPVPKLEPEIDVKALLGSYASGIKSAIVRRKQYPAVAERLGHEGSVKVSFTVDASGSLDSATIKSSSGYDELDDAALEAVRSAAPFDPIPEDAQKEQLSLSITLNFNLGS